MRARRSAACRRSACAAGACRCAAPSVASAPQIRPAPAASSAARDEQRQRELAQLFGGEVHGSFRVSVMVKRGASLDSAAPMSPVSVPSEVMSNGSWVRSSS